MSEEQESADFQSQKLVWEIEKLKAETQNLNSSNRWENRIARYTPFLPLLIAVISFYVGIYQFQNDSINKAINLQKDLDSKANSLRQELENKVALTEKETRNKFYQKQLDIYLDVTKVAAQIAVENNEANIEKLYKQFSELTHGNLGVVQDGRVKKAVIEFDETYQYRKKQEKPKELHCPELRCSAKQLADACRNSLGSKWSIPFIQGNED